MVMRAFSIKGAVVRVEHRRWNGEELELLGVTRTHNIVTDAGLQIAHTYLYGEGVARAALGTGFNFVALSDDATPPNAADVALAGEITSDGLERAQGVVALPLVGGSLTTVEYVFTYTGVAGVTVTKAALFDAATGGNMAHEVLFAVPRPLVQNDQITVTFELTVS
jgi:hypothetical protein